VRQTTETGKVMTFVNLEKHRTLFLEKCYGKQWDTWV